MRNSEPSKCSLKRKGLFKNVRLSAYSGVITLAVVLALWHSVSDLGLIPPYLLPSPQAVVVALVHDAPLIAAHTQTTLMEAACGLAAGFALGITLALIMDASKTLYALVRPLIIVSQTIPVVALAPLLVLWLGYGMAPKILLIALASFFPITMSFLEGLRSVDPDTLTLMKSLGAKPWQLLLWAKIPASLSALFAGIKIAAAYSIITAVVAEWLGGFSGLGVYMTRVRKAYAFDKMFAAIIVISLLSLALMKVVDYMRHKTIPWEGED